MDHRKQVRSWFLSLSPEDLCFVLTDFNKEECDRLRAMFLKCKNQGHGFFLPMDDDFGPNIPGLPPLPFIDQQLKRHIKPDLSDPIRNLDFKTRSSLESSLGIFFFPKVVGDAEQKIIDLIRLCDTTSYLDTFTVESNGITNSELLELLTTLTQGGFLSEFCSMVYESSVKEHRCATPNWFISKGYFTLGEYISALFEKLIWTSYCKQYGIEQSNNSNSSGLNSNTSGNSGLNSNSVDLRKKDKTIALDSRKSRLKNFWNGLPRLERERYAASKLNNSLNSIFQTLRHESNEHEVDYLEQLDILLNILKDTLITSIEIDNISKTNNNNSTSNNNSNSNTGSVSGGSNNKQLQQQLSKSSTTTTTTTTTTTGSTTKKSGGSSLKLGSSSGATGPPHRSGNSSSSNSDQHETRSMSSVYDDMSSIKTIFEEALIQNPIRFIEFLCFSPLERAGSVIDLLVREIGAQLQNYYIDKEAMDLISSEERLKKKKSVSSSGQLTPTKKKKKKAGKDPKDESAAGSSTPGSSSGNSARKKRKKKTGNAVRERTMTMKHHVASATTEDNASSNSDTEKDTIQTRPRRHSLPMEVESVKGVGVAIDSTTEDEDGMLWLGSEGDIDDHPMSHSRYSTRSIIGHADSRSPSGSSSGSGSNTNNGNSLASSSAAISNSNSSVTVSGEWEDLPLNSNNDMSDATDMFSQMSIATSGATHSNTSPTDKSLKSKAGDSSLSRSFEGLSTSSPSNASPNINVPSSPKQSAKTSLLLKSSSTSDVRSTPQSPKKLNINFTNYNTTSTTTTTPTPAASTTSQQQCTYKQPKPTRLYIQPNGASSNVMLPQRSSSAGQPTTPSTTNTNTSSTPTATAATTATKPTPSSTPSITTTSTTTTSTLPPKTPTLQQSSTSTSSTTASHKLQQTHFSNQHPPHHPHHFHQANEWRPNASTNTNATKMKSSPYGQDVKSQQPNAWNEPIIDEIIQKEEKEKEKAERVQETPSPQQNALSLVQSQQAEQLQVQATDRYKEWRHNKLFNWIQVSKQNQQQLPVHWQPWDDPPLPYPHPLFSIRLHQEILDFVSDVGERTYPHVQNCHQVIEMIRSVVKRLWPNAELEIYGSFYTGLWLPSSDVDIVVNYGKNMSIRSKNAQFLLEVLEKQIRHDLNNFILTMMCIPSARIPVIKLVTKNNIAVDISFRESPTSPHTGIAARNLVSENVETLIGLYPLAIVLKWFLRERGLNNTYSGGLSSYCLVLMLISFLKNNEHCPKKIHQQSQQSQQQDPTKQMNGIHNNNNNNNNSNNNNQPTLFAKPCKCDYSDHVSGLNIGCALMRFLEYYGVNFNYQKTGISIEESKYTFPLDDLLTTGENATGSGPSTTGGQEKIARDFSTYLYVSDPFAPGKNVAAGSFNFGRVKAAFQYAFVTLSNASMNESSGEKDAILSKIMMPDKY